MELIYSKTNPSFPKILINDLSVTPYWVTPQREWVDDIEYWLNRREEYVKCDDKEKCLNIIGEVKGFSENLSFYSNQNYERFYHYDSCFLENSGYDNLLRKGWALYESNYLSEALELSESLVPEGNESERYHHSIYQLKIYCYYQLNDIKNMVKYMGKLEEHHPSFNHKHIVWNCLKYKLDNDKDSLINSVEPLINQQFGCSNIQECVIENYMALAYYYYMKYLT